MKQIVFVFGLLYGSCCIAQNEDLAKNTFYLELGGNGFLYSINYDRVLFIVNEKLLLGGRIGFGGTFPFSFRPDDDIVLQSTGIPIEGYILVGKGNSKLDLGIGFFPNFVYKGRGEEALKLDTFVNIGYRYQKPAGGFFFKTALLAQHFNMYGINAVSPWLKLGFGYTFH